MAWKRTPQALRENWRLKSGVGRFDDVEAIVYDQPAGWSSLVARWAHNPKVGGSNPPPATTYGFGGLPA